AGLAAVGLADRQRVVQQVALDDAHAPLGGRLRGQLDVRSARGGDLLDVVGAAGHRYVVEPRVRGGIDRAVVVVLEVRRDVVGTHAGGLQREDLLVVNRVIGHRAREDQVVVVGGVGVGQGGAHPEAV